MTERQGIAIDYGRKCRSERLDRGEEDRLTGRPMLLEGERR